MKSRILLKSNQKLHISDSKKQHPKTHTPLYIELIIPFKILLKSKQKLHISDSKKQHPKTHTPLYIELIIPLKILLKSKQKLHISACRSTASSRFFSSCSLRFLYTSRSSHLLSMDRIKKKKEFDFFYSDISTAPKTIASVLSEAFSS